MSAVENDNPEIEYRIRYFDGEQIAELKVAAESREQAVSVLKQLGYGEGDIFSIEP
ncbi:hypothetical protein [Vibrio sonorensis]|uniref:hypothetical protein n=1 Tax=Vibrio sonorensis TaxID=1004316 RepID=UPI001586E137|nr:hypothetical protein [Vibrio sonorensis]